MISRRRFLQTSTAALGGILASTRGFPSIATGRAPDQILKVGVVGCGGRGTGAAAQALKADPHVRLTAMADVFADRLQLSLETVRRNAGEKVAVTPENCFVGFDAFRKVIESDVDVVILATPPAFRPEHLRAAVAAGKHVFCEKPVAVDGPGVRSILESAAEAKRKNLALVSGFCWRYHDGIRECMERIHGGAIGEIRALHATYYTSTLSTKFPGVREPEWTEMEFQMRNWYNFCWISGDHLVEQAVHSVDKLAWAMRDEMPVLAIATGGRQIPSYGNIYDHFQINYEYAGGVRAFLGCRQQDNCHRETADYYMGEKGIFSNGRSPFPQITGAVNWRYQGNPRNMYQAEHDELFVSIRSGRPINDGVNMAHSTMMAIMGRMAAYTGQAISWEQAINSQESLVPDKLDWNLPVAVTPTPMPGQTRFL